MADPYPIGTQSATLNAADSLMKHVKTYLTSRIAQMAAGNVSASVILEVNDTLVSDMAGLNTAKAFPGIAAYAQAQKSDGTLDVVAAFNGVIAAMQGVLDWIAANFPADGGYLKVGQLTPQYVERSFTPALTAPLRTAMQAVVDLITEVS